MSGCSSRRAVDGRQAFSEARGKLSSAIALAMLLLVPCWARAEAWRPIGIEGFPRASALAID